MAHQAGVLDDALRGVGVKPHPEPNPGDVQLLTSAADALESFGATVAAAAQDTGLKRRQRRFLETARAIADEQLQAVSRAPSKTSEAASGSVATVVTLAETMAEQRAADALAAVAPAVSQVLASMAAGLDQLLVAGKQIQ